MISKASHLLKRLLPTAVPTCRHLSRSIPKNPNENPEFKSTGMQFIVDSLKPKNFPVLVVVVGILYEFVSIDSQVKATAGDLRSLKTDNNASFDKIAAATKASFDKSEAATNALFVKNEAATKASFDKSEAATKASFDKMEAKLDIVAKVNQESLEKVAKENRESLEKAAKENRILREASAKESRDLFLNMVMHLSNSGSQHRPNGGDDPPASTPLPSSTSLHTPI
jgi:hypothetical protein